MMAATPKELEYETMTSVGKVSVTDDSTAILLGLIGFSATKLWNTAVWHTKKTWEATGKIMHIYSESILFLTMECQCIAV